MKKILLVTILLFHPEQALAQDTSVSGNCNAVVVGDGNNVTIDCSGLSAGQSKATKVKLVIATDSTPVVIGNLNWAFVNSADSDFTLKIDNDQVVYGSMSAFFSDEKVEIKRGEHFYEMEVNLAYLNGTSQQASCSGIVDAQISASIVPRMLIAQNAVTGQISPIRCGFQLR